MKSAIAKYIDYTLLKPDATAAEIERMAQEARLHGFATLCIQPVFVKECAKLLAGSGVGVTTVIGFPLGVNKTDVKAFEAEQAIADGATEIDMVVNIGALIQGENTVVKNDVEKVVAVASGRALVKVIIETAYLNPQQIRAASQIVKAAGADFVKTSTGFASRGASLEDITIIRNSVGPDFGIKAAGGIASYAIAQAMLAAGATRLGASAGLKIIAEEKQAIISAGL